MAYITATEVKEIRNNLKAEFPAKAGWKFSVRKREYSMLCVTILKAPIDLIPVNQEGREYAQVNHYYVQGSFQTREAEMYIQKIINICNENNFDKSDRMTDLHHVGYYFDLKVGTWDKPFLLVA